MTFRFNTQHKTFNNQSLCLTIDVAIQQSHNISSSWTGVVNHIMFSMNVLNFRPSDVLLKSRRLFSAVNLDLQRLTLLCDNRKILQQADVISNLQTDSLTVKLPFWTLDHWSCAFHNGSCLQFIGVSPFLRDYACKLTEAPCSAMTSAYARVLHRCKVTKVLRFSKICVCTIIEVLCFPQTFYCKVTDIVHNVWFLSRKVLAL